MTAKIALVTGASRGLGYALSLALAPEYHVVAVARTTGALEELDDAIRLKGGEATLAPLDITTDAAMQQLCRSIYDRWGKVDLWVHTAIHAGPLAIVSDISEKDMARCIDVNVAATARLIRYLSPLLGSDGHAVFFAPEQDQAGHALWGAYGTTKSAQIALARSWQQETQKTGPAVSVLDTPQMPTATRARFYPGTAPNDLPPPAQVAEALLPDIMR